MMNSADEVRFVEVLRALASMTKTEVTPYMMQRYASELKPFGFDKAADALESLFNDVNSSTRFPSINQIKALLGEITFTNEEIARDAIQRIRDAISRFGGYRADEAKNYIGEMGWHTVQMMGGWNQVCDFNDQDSLNIALAQAREYTKVAVKKESGGTLHKPALPESMREKKITMLASSENLHD